MNERHGRATTRASRPRSTLAWSVLLAACLVACDAPQGGTPESTSPPSNAVRTDVPQEVTQPPATPASAVGGEAPSIEDAALTDAGGGAAVEGNGTSADDADAARPADGAASTSAAAGGAAAGGPGRGGEEASVGHVLYDANCAICHGASGGGGVGPALADNPNVQVTDYAVAQVLLGGGGMPPFAPRLADAEIAAVLTFVRTGLGNDAGPVRAEEVDIQRSGLRPGIRLGPSAAVVDPFAPVDGGNDGGGESAGGGNGADEESMDGGDGAAGAADGAADEQPSDAEERTVAADETPADAGEAPADAERATEAAASDRSGGLALGERLYVQQGCSGCHGAGGGGGIGPALAGNEALEDAAFVIDRILHGGGGMPPFAAELNDEEVAAVASHERTAWGNDFGSVDAGRVAERRSASEDGP